MTNPPPSGDSTPAIAGKLNVLRRSFNLPRNVLAISFVSFLNDASSEIIYPLLPLFLALTLSASPVAIGIIEGAAESLSGLLKLFSGYWSDRRGARKPLVVGGYALAGLVRPLLGFATAWQQVFALRLIDRTGKGIRSAPRDAMIADAASPEQRGLAFGFHRAMDHAGAVVGPVIGWLLLQSIASNAANPTAQDYRTIFLLAAVPALAAVLVATILVRESHPSKQTVTISPLADSPLASFDSVTPITSTLDAPATPRQHAPRFTLRGFDKNFMRFLFIVALFTLSNSSDAFLLLRAQNAGVTTSLIPLLWAVLHVCKVISSILGGDQSDRIGRKRLIVAGWLVYALVYAGFAFADSTLEIWLLFIVYGVYFGLVEGTEKALVADLVRPEQRGTAFGLYNLAFSITVFPASLLMGGIWKFYGAPTAFLASACMSIVATLLLAYFVKPHANTQTPQPAT